MRDILFRGKRTDGKGWMYGYYSFNPTTNIHWIRIPRTTYWDEDMVDTATVGQYAGLTDKNGKRIFEGDIIRTHYANTIATDFVEQVVFHNGRFTSLYELHGPGNGKMFANLPDGVPHFPQDKTPYMDWCEVIGNIHDNPELLKEGDV